MPLHAQRVARHQSARSPFASVARISVRSATSVSQNPATPSPRRPEAAPGFSWQPRTPAPSFFPFSELAAGGFAGLLAAPGYVLKSKDSGASEPAEKPLKSPELGPKDKPSDGAAENDAPPPKNDENDVPAPKELDVPADETPGSSGVPTTAGSSGAAALGGSGNNNGNGGGNNNGKNGGNGDAEAVEMVLETGAYPPFLAIAMKDRPQLPGREFSINISDPKVKSAVTEICSRREPHFVLFHMNDPDMPDTDVIQDRKSVYDIGAHCFVLRTYEDGDNLRILGRVMERCRLEKLVTPDEQAQPADPEEMAEDFPTLYLRDFGVSYARVTRCDDEPFDADSPEIKFLVAQVKAYFEVIDSKIPSKKIVTTRGASLLNSPSQLADFIGSLSAAPADKIQELLLELNVEARLRKALELFKVELKSYYTLIDTTMEITSKAEEAQHKQFIKEYIKGLQRHIGGPEAASLKTAKFDERIQHMKLTEEAMEAYNTEKAKLESGQEHSSELAVSEKYLDWLTLIPWGIYSKDRFNVKLAKTVLDRDHYGLKDVKDRILEFISMGKISGKVDGKILCLVGPPGTGKTSIAKSIAESLDRRYVRIAMGGIQDVHEVKGHRRTYVGSIPGRIISSLKQAKTSNPLLLIDEIDKLDMSKSGGAASAFLEILDPEQNNAFVDNYIDVKVDLSKVLFVCTANYLGNIPGPLRDRMEVIEVPGYTNNEKFEIVTKHLIPNAAKRANLDESRVSISAESVRRLIDKYCRESGLRNLKKLITRIFSKASLKIVQELEEREPAEATETAKKAAPSNNPDKGDSNIVQEFKTLDTSIEKGEIEKGGLEKSADSSVLPHEIPEDIKLDVTPKVLKDYVGPEIYTKTRVYDLPPPGVATGLAYSTSGNGDALYIESILTNSIGAGTGSAGMRVTGHLKDVMKESASIAYSFSKLFMVKKYPANRFFEGADIHVHCPEGAVPKDGPSAGIAFTSSLISLALNQSLPPNVAMTGEITLTGKVSAVGGLREKILGAKRYGYDTIIFPKDIENELEEVSEEVKDGMTFVPVLWYDEVFAAIFPGADADKINRLWKKEFAKRDEKKSKPKK
ncbi:ATP-dependent protease La [Metschnikowia bicuspidata var. bicuspidata NRRL YB-4993]|uniref:endopeptidase La n=1 Tax=Metschnikowia bicuspidata var. bicuspidata NRRL YB-4993 TaxID=869754 RepID=A0A1A0H5X1_9ASCO|nr:ATP-dependent protease La [Metschnikowia bicuspidata var. bicuspidata NRRL YB-4993]OBA19431.1 ATP-dependent protease La [Metschnikowia bicuspidata var. bicuspidata NRRL YB-4993]